MKQGVKKGLLCFFVLLLCFLAFEEVTFADVGNSFSGGSSGGSSYSGGYGGGYYGGGFFTFLPFTSPFGLVIMLLVIALIVWGTKNKRSSQSTGGVNAYSNPGFQSNAGLNEGAVIAKIKETDPDFSADLFKTYVKDVYLNVQEAWEKKRWDMIRPFESNALFRVHERQLQEYIDMKQTNYMNRQNIRDCHISGYRIDGEFEVITVKLDASLLDYVIDDETNEVIEGSKTQYQYRSYRLELIRKAGVKTKVEEGISTTNCPNCGAPTQVTAAGQCEFCKSVITSGDYGWVLNHYGRW